MKKKKEVGLLLNGDRTVVLTNEARPPSHLWTHTGIKLQVKNGPGGHKWLGCILGVGKAGRTNLDVAHHLEAASKAFFANKTILCERTVPVKDRLRYFSHYWKLAIHFASVPHDRWIQRILRWMPGGRHTAGCPRHNWATKLDASCDFCKWTNGKYWHEIRHFGYTPRRTSFFFPRIFFSAGSRVWTVVLGSLQATK